MCKPDGRAHVIASPYGRPKAPIDHRNSNATPCSVAQAARSLGPALGRRMEPCPRYLAPLPPRLSPAPLQPAASTPSVLLPENIQGPD